MVGKIGLGWGKQKSYLVSSFKHKYQKTLHSPSSLTERTFFGEVWNDSGTVHSTLVTEGPDRISGGHSDKTPRVR